jgi:site-specific DNA recombinase
MKTVLYARVSTADMATNGVSLDAQVAKLRAYATALDLEVVEVVVDAGESAKTLNRRGIQQALAMLRNGQADALCVTKLDRLTRSIVDWQTLIDGYFSEKAGRQLISLSESIDTRTAMSRCVLGILMCLSQAEREQISERTTQALQYKISKGERCGRVRYGYDVAADGKTLLENVGEQQTIALICQLRASGLSLQDIATELNSRSIPTKTGTTGWIHTAVNRILKRTPAKAVA